MDTHRRQLYRYALCCDRLYRLRLHLGSWRARQRHKIVQDIRAARAVQESIRKTLCQDGRIDHDVDQIRRLGRIYNR